MKILGRSGIVLLV